MKDLPVTFIRGFTMGAADVVPGVSGGTVALVYGIYNRLINAIRNGARAMGRVAKGDLKGGLAMLKEVEWRFLLPLLAGILTAVATLSGVIESLLEDSPVEMAGLFLGLVLGSVVVAFRLLTSRDALRLAVMALATVATFVLLGLKEGTSEDAVQQISNPALWAFFGAGAIAICAMILPGISGSFLLVTMGMYAPVLASVTDRDLGNVAVFAAGCVIGLALFSQVLHWALSNHYNTVMAALIGLMLGSVRVLWPWPAGVDSTALEAPADPVVMPLVLAAVGFGVVIAVEVVARQLEQRTLADESDELRSV
ncbi:MAG TPA: DUF368 domain-containing protein [Acidimicrobiaceae bacterium]|nr:DUF368 domain-containing protein [Acidimicrobiaceae bacterium]